MDQKQLENVEYYNWFSCIIKLNQDCHGKRSIQQEEGSFHQQTGLKFKEETVSVTFCSPHRKFSAHTVPQVNPI